MTLLAEGYDKKKKKSRKKTHGKMVKAAICTTSKNFDVVQIVEQDVDRLSTYSEHVVCSARVIT